MHRPGWWNTVAAGTIPSGESLSEIPGLCWFALRRLPPLLDAFGKEIDGVRAAGDIEYIHRMRVASRRLRAALPIFEPCFPAKSYARWMREITRITRALGEARDADVQIAYLQKFQKKKTRPAGLPSMPAGSSRDPVPAARYLLVILERERRNLQPAVEKSLDSLERSHVIDEMHAAFRDLEERARAHRRLPPLYTLPMAAAYRIDKRLLALHSYEPWISHPEAVAEHHATRIAAKKLRYTLEIYSPLYRNGLKKYLLRVKRVQEILGDLHDCDVWIDRVARILLHERTVLRSRRGADRPDPAVLASLKAFLAVKEQERRAVYRRFTRYWASLARAGTWDELRRSLENKRRTRFLPPRTGTGASARAAPGEPARVSPGSTPHGKNVTNLSLMLFDATVPLHALGGNERLLLETAGMFHGASRKTRRGGNTGHGARAVLVDEHLPFDLSSRATIMLCIALSRGKPDLSARPLFCLLEPQEQKTPVVLASLLRVADALDFRHTGAVTRIGADISGDPVVFSLISDRDCTAEKKKAEQKADLFTLALGKRVVIV